MWEALADIASERGREIHDLITEISVQHEEPNLSAATRVYIVKFYRDKLRGRDG
jgi:predicted DNA-binding ribbon-helix-helix protein